ncbi:MAG: PDZ domain-containing protein [Planctomycetota bacterium]
MIGVLALIGILFAQEPVPQPPESEQNAEILVVEVPSPVIGEWKGHIEIQRMGALEQLEAELVALYSTLSPSLVEAQFRLAAGTDQERLVVTSGVVLDNYGLVVVPILLNEEQRQVSLSEIRLVRVDGHPFEATLLAWNEDYGISLLRAPGLRGLAPKFWNGTWMQEGSPVVSIGNGFGFQSSMNFGLVSGRGRIIDKAEGLLQITNPINLADNGGLLANRRGEVIGVLMTSLSDLVHRREWESPVAEELGLGAAEAKRSEGVSFAIPIEQVFHSFPEYFPSTGTIRLMGVMVNSEIRVVEVAGSEPSYVWQLRFTSVTPGSPADQAGILPDDIVVRLNGVLTRDLQDLGQAIHDSPLSTVVVVERKGELLELPIEFEN